MSRGDIIFLCLFLAAMAFSFWIGGHITITWR